jgi:ankyrin repeat protein
VNVPDSHGVFPVMYAVQYGNANALISLIRHGANINVIDKRNGYSLLMKALGKQKIPNQYLIIVLLLKNGADVNIIGHDSKTALYLAKLYHIKYIELLKRYGAEY